MKRLGYIALGIVIGVGFTFSFGAAASEISFFGKQIDGEYTVSVNGEELPVKAGTIEGTSFLPVRVVSEALRLEVGFDENTGISLTTKKEEEFTVVESPTPSESSKEVFSRQKIESEISVLKVNISALKNIIVSYPKIHDTPENNKLLGEYEESLKLWQDRLAELED